MTRLIVVEAAYDPDAAVWHAESGDLGLRIEAPTFDALIELVPGSVQELLECGGRCDSLDIPIEVVAHVSTRVRIPEQA